MNIRQIIAKKKEGGVLSAEEIFYAVEGYTAGKIDDGPMAALLMAICWRGLCRAETAELTMAMARAGGGEVLDFGGSGVSGFVADKHSTGGVGDKTTLVAAPIAAACGVVVAKMSGGALGHTGGTLNKLAAIKGHSTNIAPARFMQIAAQTGLCIAGQSANLAPADKLIYDLRHRSAAVDCMELIAASIMSKKIAAGADGIVLDVKAGSGAFMKTRQDAEQLARLMVDIGKTWGKAMTALVTRMDAPLGRAVGNALETAEAIDILQNKNRRQTQELRLLCIELAAHMLHLAKKGNIDECRHMAEGALVSGAAYAKFAEMVAAQGGDVTCVPVPQPKFFVCAPQSGCISAINGQICGEAAALLEGITFDAQVGDHVPQGGVLASLYSDGADEAALAQAGRQLLTAYEFSHKPAPTLPLIYSIID